MLGFFRTTERTQRASRDSGPARRDSGPARRDSGFTLIELLVVLGIFSTVVVLASDIFLVTNRSQRELFGAERTQADARYTLEAIAREVRTGSIDYDYYVSRGTPIGTPDTELALVDSTDTPIRFRLSTSASQCLDATVSPCLLVRVGSGTEQSITPRNIAVLSAKFYITPATDPTIFDAVTGLYGQNVQPHVTVALQLQSRGERVTERTTVYVQTTSTSRAYSR
jgi:prepilin-type N-terminal cleavage/methylation domain-containing protein